MKQFNYNLLPIVVNWQGCKINLFINNLKKYYYGSIFIISSIVFRWSLRLSIRLSQQTTDQKPKFKIY
jgi:hypothetical protein